MSQPTMHRVRCGTVEIAYRQVGSGAPLLMFHGMEGDHQIYDRLQESLGYSVRSISFDQRDCGSTRWDNPAPYGAIDIVDDAITLLDALAIKRADVLGNSIGGILAQIMAVRWPNRIDRLVLGLTWPANERLQDLNPEGMALRNEYASKGLAGQREMLELMAGKSYVDRHPGFAIELADLAVERPADDRARRYAALSEVPNVAPSDILHRTLVIGGGEDRMVPPAISQRLAEIVPNAIFTLIEGVGHLAARQDPDGLAQAIQKFLSR